MRMAVALILAVFLGLATAAQAQRVAIRTGEHDGFTRLVLTLPEAGAWRVTRTEDGYAVAIGSGRAEYDTSDVFRLIPRTRLAGIRTDPADGRLRLTIGCQCHAWPIELRRGLLVIDLRDGPPPPGSPHERDDRGRVMAALPEAGARAPAPRPRPTPDTAQAYDWRTAALERAGGKTAMPFPAAPSASDPAPQGAAPAPAPPLPSDWRAGLVEALGRGATQGVVELAPPAATDGGGLPPGETPWPQVRIGDGPLPAGDPADPDPGVMTAQGEMCIADEALDLAAWGDPAPVSTVIGPLTRNVVEEFDRPDAVAMQRAVHYLLSVGFGAEARQIIAMAGPDLPGAAHLRALSFIMDGTVPPADAAAFAGMTGCDTAAALWSLLALPPGRAATGLREDAVLRAFSALPLHLRRHLGPSVADRLLSAGKTEAARAIRDAILRAPGDPGAAVSLMSLGIGQAAGQPPRAQDLQSLRSTPGETGLKATILSLETDVAADRTPEAPLLTAAEALLREYRGTPEAAALGRALAAAQALAGDLPRAMELATGDAEATAAVWSVLAANGSDGALLTYGLRQPADLPQKLSPETDRAIAARLIGLGFPRESAAWLAPSRRPAGQVEPDDRVLLARALLADRDARGALSTLADLATPAAEALRAEASRALNTAAEGAAPQDQAVIARRSAQWDVVARVDEGAWRDTAALVPAPVPAGDGPLSQARALREESAAARATIEGLLQASRLPDVP